MVLLPDTWPVQSYFNSCFVRKADTMELAEYNVNGRVQPSRRIDAIPDHEKLARAASRRDLIYEDGSSTFTDETISAYFGTNFGLIYVTESGSWMNTFGIHIHKLPVDQITDVISEEEEHRSITCNTASGKRVVLQYGEDFEWSVINTSDATYEEPKNAWPDHIEARFEYKEFCVIVNIDDEGIPKFTKKYADKIEELTDFGWNGEPVSSAYDRFVICGDSLFYIIDSGFKHLDDGIYVKPTQTPRKSAC